METPAIESNNSGSAPAAPRGFPWVAAGLTVCLALCCAILFRMAWRAGRELPFFQVDAAQTAALQTPDWMPAEWVAEAQTIITNRPVFSIFDDATVQGICDELQKLPWVKSARESERGLPRTLRIAITPRTPVGIVESKGALVLVDGEGMVLPAGSFAPERLAPLPRIIKWKGDFTNPVVGAQWKEDAVMDGVSVAMLLPQLYFSTLKDIAPDFRIVNIDVANVDGVLDSREPEILLTTSSGARIKWGRAPRSIKFGEVPTETKFKNLVNVLREFPGLAGISVVNLRFDEPDLFDAQGQWIPRQTLVTRSDR